MGGLVPAGRWPSQPVVSARIQRLERTRTITARSSTAPDRARYACLRRDSHIAHPDPRALDLFAVLPYVVAK